MSMKRIILLGLIALGVLVLPAACVVSLAIAGAAVTATSVPMPCATATSQEAATCPHPNRVGSHSGPGPDPSPRWSSGGRSCRSVDRRRPRRPVCRGGKRTCGFRLLGPDFVRVASGRRDLGGLLLHAAFADARHPAQLRTTR